ncbi:DNRLRE domain-containing protein [Arthrobacter sp. B3I9]|uniref:DNRLRE domain-containing protein n=1 Tax=Arthrobacter sp. B3I9 TaxID=3042270 RepID=UPI0027D7D112|nr:DNRLRE domain-containing protein [Arthrobacter sp. B3I9]
MNFAAFDAYTGNPTSCALSATGGTGTSVRALAVTPDGTRLYVGGQFGAISGVNTTRLAAIKLPGCTVDTTFKPQPISAVVRTIAATNTAVYFGGDFQSIGSTPRGRFAAVDNNGALLPWAPDANAPGRALTVPAGRNVAVIGGDFATVNGVASQSLAVVDATTGANVRAYGAAFIPRTSFTKSIVDDGQSFYIGNEGTGSGVFDGRARFSLDTYDQTWRDTCLGATQAVDVYNRVLYAASHEHDCSTMNQLADGERQHLTAQSVDNPAPQLGWSPDTNEGIGEMIGPRALVHTSKGSGDVLWVAGEFTTTNGKAQQGLTRFGPGPGTVAPSTPSNVSAASLVSGENQIRWRASLDNDDSELTYSVYRNGSSTPLGTVKGSSLWWSTGQVSFTDKTALPGTQYSYRIRATDGTNTGPLSASVTVTTARNTAAYPAAVLGAGATTYWRLDDAGPTVGADSSAGNNLELSYGGPAFAGGSGAITNDPSRSTTFNGTSAFSYGQVRGNAPTVYTAEVWFKTNTTQGGKIFGFGNGQPNRHGTNPGLSGNYDRNLYMTNAGTLVYGVYVNGTRTITSALPYNDDAWHHAVATQGGDGMRLYVDGAQLGVLPNQTTAQTYWGSWKVGGDQLNSWPLRPTSNYFAGSIDEFAVYPSVLSATQVTDHYKIGKGIGQPVPDTQAPAAVTGVSATVTKSDVAVSWNASTDNVGVTGYQIHRAATSGFAPSEATLVAAVNGSTLSWTDAGRPAGTSYYQVLAVDEAGNVSGPSNEATATVAPAPQAVSLRLTPTADTYVNSGAPNTAGGSYTTLATRGTPAYITYMRFNAASQVPAGQHLVSAVLTFSTTGDSFAGSNDPQQTVAMAGDWSEATTTYNNRPQTSSTTLGTLAGSTAPNTSYSINLDAAAISAALAGDINFSMQSSGTDNMWFFSREATLAKRPALVLTFEPNA